MGLCSFDEIAGLVLYQLIENSAIKENNKNNNKYFNILTKCCPSKSCDGDDKSKYKQKVCLLGKHILCNKDDTTHDQRHDCGQQAVTQHTHTLKERAETKKKQLLALSKPYQYTRHFS